MGSGRRCAASWGVAELARTASTMSVGMCRMGLLLLVLLEFGREPGVQLLLPLRQVAQGAVQPVDLLIHGHQTRQVLVAQLPLLGAGPEGGERLAHALVVLLELAAPGLRGRVLGGGLGPLVQDAARGG